MSVSSQLVNHNSAAIQQDQIFSLVLGPGGSDVSQAAGRHWQKKTKGLYSGLQPRNTKKVNEFRGSTLIDHLKKLGIWKV
jgi:hypothetical protein